MIFSIQGRILQYLDRSIVLEDSSGIAWELEISQQTRKGIAHEVGDQIRLYTHLHLREDNITLYGFLYPEEKEIFLLLNKVNGIGPRQSMRILSSVEPTVLLTAIQNEDTLLLTSLPGIGAKGAGKIILTLKDSISLLTGFPIESQDGKSRASATKDNLISALVNMGFDRPAVSSVLAEILSDKGRFLDRSSSEPQSDSLANPAVTDKADIDKEEGEILREAIIRLSRKDR